MDVVWAKLKLDTADAKKAIQSYNTEVIKSERVVKSAGDAGTAAFDKQAKAIKGATDAQRKLQSESTKTGSTFSSAINKTASSIGGISASLGQVAAGLGVAFGTQQIIAFGKEAINQFAEAELNAKKLSFAVKNIANESEASFNRLIAQSGKIQENSIFSDDDIQRAQTALLQYGLTTTQVEKLVPAIVDLASATGEDLSSAQDRVLNGINGQTKGLKDVGLQFKDTGDKTKNYAIILDGLNRKFSGATADALNSTDGKLKNLKNQFGELQESLGGEIIPLLSNLIEGVNLFNEGDPGGGIDKITDTIQVGLPFIQEIKEAYEAFSKGQFWKGMANVGETVLSLLTLGFYTRVKNYFTPAAKIIGDGYTDFEKAKIKIINATDKEIQKQRELIKAQGQSTEEFDKYVKSVRESEVVKIFEELANALEITKEQYKELTDISDKYGRSAAINSSLILDISKATNEDLEVAFAKFNKTLGVTRKDFDDYIGKVKKIPPLQRGVGESTKTQMIGPYEALTKAVSSTISKLQDFAALALKGTSLDNLTEKSAQLKKAQFELALANSLVTISLGDYTKELEDLSKFMDGNGKFLFDIKGGEVQEAKIQGLIANYNEMVRKLKELKAINDELEKQDEENAKLQEDRNAQEKKFAEERMQTQQQAWDFLKQLNIGQVAQYQQSLKDLEAFRDADLISEKDYLAAKEKLYSEQVSALAGALAGATQALSDAMSQIFGEAAQKNVLFLAFQKALTITTITLKSIEAIAGGIAKLASQDPLNVITGVASIIAGVGNLIGGLISEVNSIQTPQAPSFFDGTGDTGPGGHLDSKGGFAAILHPHEGVLNARGNMAFSGLADAVNMGKGEDYMIRHVAGRMINDHNMAQKMADSLMLNAAFNDKRLYKNGQDHTYLLKQNNVLLAKMLKGGNNPWAV